MDFSTNDWIIAGVAAIMGGFAVMHALFGTRSRPGGGVQQYSGEFDKKYFIAQMLLCVAMLVLLLLDQLGIYSTDNIIGYYHQFQAWLDSLDKK